jgi:RPA family protein
MPESFQKAGSVMATIREIEVSAIDSEARIILESLYREMERLKAINASSEDEGEAADAGNDYLEVSSLYDKIREIAVSTFGNQITNFSNEYI